MSEQEKTIINADVSLLPDETDFYKSIADLIRKARRELEKSVNTVMVLTHYEIGKRIIEKEQGGEKRAQYGKRILQDLSDYLTAELGGGFSVDNLKLMRKFYTVYSELQKGESPIPQFSPNISWTHYIQLMRIKDSGERGFYENEITNNNWSIREFQRQYNFIPGD